VLEISNNNAIATLTETKIAPRATPKTVSATSIRASHLWKGRYWSLDMLSNFLNLWISLVILADFAFFRSIVGGATQQKEVSENFALAAYLPDYQIGSYVEKQLSQYSSTNAPPLLTDLILFSLQPHSKGFLGGCCLQNDHFAAAHKFREELYEKNGRRLTLWVTIGGSGRSDAFSQICPDETLRKRLIQSAINLW
jgi:hypothetical protein